MSLSEENIQHLWNRLLDQRSSVFGICSVDEDGHMWGFAHYIIHESTSQLNPICCLQDLFVDQACRKNGIGSELIEWLLKEMKSQGWGRVYWHTRENNYKARALYDKFTSKNDFLRYVVESQ
jgi:GNAT superfamily N-acetyltransferase